MIFVTFHNENELPVYSNIFSILHKFLTPFNNCQVKGIVLDCNVLFWAFCPELQ